MLSHIIAGLAAVILLLRRKDTCSYPQGLLLYPFLTQQGMLPLAEERARKLLFSPFQKSQETDLAFSFTSSASQASLATSLPMRSIMPSTASSHILTSNVRLLTCTSAASFPYKYPIIILYFHIITT